jgi:hypothetical protein
MLDSKFNCDVESGNKLCSLIMREFRRVAYATACAFRFLRQPSDEKPSKIGAADYPDATVASAATHASLVIHNVEPTGGLLPKVVDTYRPVCSPEGR